MELLLRNGHIFTPNYAGVNDLLVENGIITCIRPNIEVSAFACAREIDAKGMFIMPAFIDTRVYFSDIMKEAQNPARAFQKNGITGCVLVPDKNGRKTTVDMLNEKTSGFIREGMETLYLTGSFYIPISGMQKTAEDMDSLSKCAGAGEIAIEDSRASAMPLEQIALLLQMTYKICKKTDKPLKAVFYMGDKADSLSILFRLQKINGRTFEIAVPAYVNRNENVLKDAVEYIKTGGTVDITAGIPLSGINCGVVPAADALMYIYEKTGGLNNVILSGDAGSQEKTYDENKSAVKKRDMSAISFELTKAYKRGIKISELIKTVTVNAAKTYGFRQGEIFEGANAYINITDDDLNIKNTIIRDILLQ